jgi:hypothetical protein
METSSSSDVNVIYILHGQLSYENYTPKPRPISLVIFSYLARVQELPRNSKNAAN